MGIHENTPWEYHTVASMQVSLERKNAQIESLAGLTSRSYMVRGRALDGHKRFLLSVASSDLHSRVHKVVSIARRKGSSIHAIVCKLDEAVSRISSTYSYNEIDFQRSYLLWKLGGQRAADVAHRSLGLPSISTTRRRFIVQPIQPSPAMPTADEMDQNLKTYFPSFTRRSNSPLVLGFVMSVDEMKLEERMRWDPATNMILGIYCLRRGDATVIALTALSSDHHDSMAHPFVVSGTCKREGAEIHRDLLRNAVDAFRRNVASAEVRCKLYCIASDGESRRAKALALLTMSHELALSSAIYKLLQPLELFNRLVGEDDLTCDKDWNTFSRDFRNTLLRKSGITMTQHILSRPMIKRHLSDGLDMSSQTCEALLSPNDPQDVVLALRLLNAISMLPPPAPNATPIYREARRTLNILGRIYYHLLEAFTNIHLSLVEELIHLSAAAHLILALYTTDKGGFIPAPLLLDVMIMVKNVFFCIAKTIVDNPDGSFWIILLGTDPLENIFALVRTMVGNDSNADQLQFASRATGATQCSKILKEHPEWDRGPRRLHVKPLHQQGDDISAKYDHLNAVSWIGDVTVRNVVLQSQWLQGLGMPIDILHPFGDGKVVYVNGLRTGEAEEEYDLPVMQEQTGTAPGSSDIELQTGISLEPDIEDLLGAEDVVKHGKNASVEAWLAVTDNPQLRNSTKVQSFVCYLILEQAPDPLIV
ncbi:hypothetical protein BKA93DRAFT_819930 [Sparassis latifolia]